MRIEHEALATADTTVHTAALTISKIHGFKVAANDRFLQLHNTKTTPAAAAVPLRVWPIYGSAPFGEGFIADDISCSVGATFVVSTTANTYTASAETVDIFVNGDRIFDNTGVTTAGDYTSAITERLVVASSSTPRRLLRLEFTSLSDAGADLYAKVFGSDTAVAPGDMPVCQMKLRQNQSEDFFFDLPVQWRKSGTLYQGIYVLIDSTAGAAAANYLGTDYAIKGTYR